MLQLPLSPSTSSERHIRPSCQVSRLLQPHHHPQWLEFFDQMPQLVARGIVSEWDRSHHSYSGAARLVMFVGTLVLAELQAAGSRRLVDQMPLDGFVALQNEGLEG